MTRATADALQPKTRRTMPHMATRRTESMAARRVRLPAEKDTDSAMRRPETIHTGVPLKPWSCWIAPQVAGETKLRKNETSFLKADQRASENRERQAAPSARTRAPGSRRFVRRSRIFRARI